MPGTKVYTLGALPVGMPNQGGPIQFIESPYPQPEWRMNFAPQVPTSWIVPQNLLRPTWKGRSGEQVSSGAPITSALAGVAAPSLAGAGEGEAQTYCTTESGAMAIGGMLLGYRLLGATFAGMHGYRRNGGKTWPTVGWAAAGFFLPLLAGAAALVQGYAKKK